VLVIDNPVSYAVETKRDTGVAMIRRFPQVMAGGLKYPQLFDSETGVALTFISPHLEIFDFY
jgi:hypothetical protein